MRTVLAFGTFDILHTGHLYYLKRAKSYGNRLIVVVARDKNVRRIKGKKPINNERERLKMVSALKPVDKAVLGSKSNMLQKILSIKPQVIALGYDHKTKVSELKEKLKNKKIKTRIVRIPAYKIDRKKTSLVRKKILSSI